jgi:fructuronate reductase
MSAPKRLRREPGTPTPPVRIVHLGLGAFHRAHQAWYTARATDAADWGIAAFTMRAPDAAVPLAEQDGLYTLVERGADGDRMTVVDSIVEARDGADVLRLRTLLADPAVALATLTITERGYGLRADGGLDAGFHADDLGRLRHPDDVDDVRTALGRLLAGLRDRRAAAAGPIAVVPCDNLPDNGRLVRAAMLELAGAVDPGLAAWVRDEVSFVDTSVDRITPRTTARDLEAVRAATGRDDLAPVVTEPFSSWVLAGDFPAGRPDWESAGAVFTDEVGPYVRRKLWLLNGAHTMLAARGLRAGHETVAEAFSDTAIAADVEEFWRAAARHLPGGLGIEQYLADLRSRFANGRIEHRLRQIQEDAGLKFRLRILPVVAAERAEGRRLPGVEHAVADWVALGGDASVLDGVTDHPSVADVAPATMHRTTTHERNSLR